jgi:hypothetical protein
LLMASILRSHWKLGDHYLINIYLCPHDINKVYKNA